MFYLSSQLLHSSSMTRELLRFVVKILDVFPRGEVGDDEGSYGRGSEEGMVATLWLLSFPSGCH